METGETMVEILRATNTTNASSTGASTSTTTAPSSDNHEGIRQYYILKIEGLQVNEKNL